MKQQPLWLQDPAIRELLTAVVDRLDRAEGRGSETLQSMPLNERTWPALYRATRESDKEALWRQFGSFAEWGWVTVKPAAALSRAGGYADAPRVTVVDVAALRAAAGRPERLRTASERWREAVNAKLEGSEESKAAAGAYCIDIPGRNMADVVQQLNGLRELADKPLLLREVSSQLFWGMSKVLDNRQGLVAAVLGSENPFPESPLQLHAHLGRDPHGFLFIENLATFERACRSSSSQLEGLTVLYASGFKASAARLRSPHACSVFFSARGDLSDSATAAFEDWLFTDTRTFTPVFFWGDLDFAGMRIIGAMARTFPGIDAWPTGYAPMLRDLEQGGGHAPESADKQGQIPVGATGAPYADSDLLPALMRTGRFVDQEQFSSLL